MKPQVAGAGLLTASAVSLARALATRSPRARVLARRPDASTHPHLSSENSWCLPFVVVASPLSICSCCSQSLFQQPLACCRIAPRPCFGTFTEFAMPKRQQSWSSDDDATTIVVARPGRPEVLVASPPRAILRETASSANPRKRKRVALPKSKSELHNHST
jgi:hypothetical protein